MPVCCPPDTIVTTLCTSQGGVHPTAARSKLLRRASVSVGLLGYEDSMSPDPEFPGAAQWVPASTSLAGLDRAAQKCKGCDLFREATQAVVGGGPEQASLMLVGEQPGDQEDAAGHPFVGPAGALLDRALEAAGITR